ncbi:MAG TPA: carbamoyltransferase C-terminal domain-containing protein [Candidatus Paceibacterota bacterium]|nr:carbamoyltransferase C-terminal domain-containing protein [Candidatus Paceibacterota bacterium]
MRILGISFGHNATAAVLESGRIVFCQSEERINRLKNSLGFPEKTVGYILKTYGLNNDKAVFYGKFPSSEYLFLQGLNFQSKRLAQWSGRSFGKSAYPFFKYCCWKLINKPFVWLYIIKDRTIFYAVESNRHLRRKGVNFFSQSLKIDNSKVVFMDHHTSHALAPCFNLNEKTLIFTLDGAGDNLCGSVSVYDRGEFEILARVHKFNSLGLLWSNLAVFLGMKPIEDEYKIMGLAPYAKKEHAERICGEFRKILWLNSNNEFRSAFPAGLAGFFYLSNFINERFDNLAGGIQMFTEEMVTDWIRGWIGKTGIRNIALSGGLFMNVKLNQKIGEMEEVGGIFIMPSGGDESTVFGACFYGYKKYCEENELPFEPKPFDNLYLGQDFTDEEIKKYINDNKIIKKHKVELYDNIEKKISELLAANQIVARFKGPMEFGARALGNRSILAHPSNFDNVRLINKMIKSRDFWMPFAPSILEEEADMYIVNPKKIKAPYMTITFNTTELGREHLKAAIHPYDFTTRPQIVSKEQNLDYYGLIREFKKLTGIGAVLNTSFNLHGEPIVCSPEDAVRTFENSGLQYLALGNYLVQKP